MLENMRFIGQDILRREDDYLLRGQGRFVDDLPLPADTLHLGFILSPHAHARIVAINTTQATALEGVVAGLRLRRECLFRRLLSGRNRHRHRHSERGHAMDHQDPDLRLPCLRRRGPARERIPYDAFVPEDAILGTGLLMGS